VVVAPGLQRGGRSGTRALASAVVAIGIVLYFFALTVPSLPMLGAELRVASYSYDLGIKNAPALLPSASPAPTADASDRISSTTIAGGSPSVSALVVAAEGASAGASELATVGPGTGVGPGAASIGDSAFSNVERVIAETTAGKGNITSTFTLSSSDALEAGQQFLGEGYTELGQPGSGVFRSADELRQFRIDPGSLLGEHGPGIPHFHLETFESGATVPSVNNHIPFYEDLP
jgi:hypothetical protein